MLVAFIVHIILVMLSNMDVIDIPMSGAASIELHNTLASFSTVFGLLLAFALLALFLALALSFGIAAGRS